jgi:hypothetical protein
MDLAGIGLGLLLLGLIAAAVYFIKHHPNPAPVPTAQTAAAVAATVADTVASEVAKIPALVSAEVQRLSSDLEAANARVAAAEAALEAERNGKQTFVDQVRAAAQAVLDAGPANA